MLYIDLSLNICTAGIFHNTKNIIIRKLVNCITFAFTQSFLNDP